jgi:pheromone shutdown protein TraB
MSILAINASSLQLPEGEERKVREYINTPQGAIEIYEPTQSDVNEIIAIQREIGVDFNQDVIEFDSMTMLKKIFPLLTNIETNDLPDEELFKITQNPSIHLLIAQNIVAQIISEANKLFAEQLKAELLSADTLLAQSELINSIPRIIHETAKRDKNVADTLKEISRQSEEILKVIEEEESQQEEVNKDADLPNP